MLVHEEQVVVVPAPARRVAGDVHSDLAAGAQSMPLRSQDTLALLALGQVQARLADKTVAVNPHFGQIASRTTS